MKNLKVGVRLILSFIFVAALTTILGIAGYKGLNSTKAYLDNSNKTYLPSVDFLAKMRFNLRNLVVVQRTLLLDRLSTEERQRQHTNFENARTAYREAIDGYEALPQTPEETVAWNVFKKNIEKGIVINNEIMALMVSWEKDTTNKELENKLTDLIIKQGGEANRAINESLAKVIEINLKNAQNDIASADKEVSFLTSLMLFLAIASPIASILLGLYISSTISKPLNNSLDFANAVSNGDFGTRLQTVGSDEVAKLGEALNKMVTALKEKISAAESATKVASEEMEKATIATNEAEDAKIHAEKAKAEGMFQAAQQLETVVEIVTSASEQLSAQIEQSSRGSEEQAQSIAETATAMEEMNATVLEVAKNASNAASTADQAKVKAEEGARAVSQVVQGIGQVQNQSQEMKTDMDNLGKQAEGIGQILSVISDIADQTNLLALNAAIEAARAGEAGRGFAVVADEVRKLAEKTMTATKEVGAAIRGIQDGTKKNIENVERTGRNIEEVTHLATNSGEALQQIVTLAEKTTDQVRSIATASEEQSATSEEINRSIESVNRISSETADGMRQSAEAVTELANQAQVLKRLIDEMKSESGSSSNALPAGKRPLALGNGRR
ncbi:HAMP domain-containing protein [Desulfovibrio aerotolerans]|uniref:HAMP domain-containing protein n=1 Tax=Solidesulfovibrio aerotolerans TaxID=295255 RepID=A0A7C9MKT2_9BACT|nr:HAMP domain-containing methyl-accepting chemotaxis protein [Solidesulfovibrio aerotolerans]MYL84928.1 HAMP domain-containing protein [Solidesulfovibrio aerotolerans]